MVWLAAIIAILVGGAGALLVVRRRRFEADSDALITRICAGPPTDMAGLPPRVRAFAKRNGGGSGGPYRAVVLTQQSELKQGIDKPWVATPAQQHIALGTCGFVWSAQQGAIPTVRVIDSFVEGRGLLHAVLFGAITVARGEGPVADRAEAMRYLAELPWVPDAILGNPELRWDMVSDDIVEVCLPMDPEAARVTFRFDDGGDIAEMLADDRPEIAPDGTIRHRKWRGLFRDYQRIGGRRIPTGGEVGYVDEFAGYLPYWRGRVTGYRLLEQT